MKTSLIVPHALQDKLNNFAETTCVLVLKFSEIVKRNKILWYQVTLEIRKNY